MLNPAGPGCPHQVSGMVTHSDLDNEIDVETERQLLDLMTGLKGSPLFRP
jgi:hypothetical protein